MHFKSNPLLEQSNINVDREQNVVKNVCIAQHGENKNGSYFGTKFLEDLVTQGNEQKQGVKSRFGHPNMCASSLGTFVGRYKNFTLKDNAVYADLHLDPISKKTQVEGKGISMHEYIMDMAETNSDMFGNSIVVSCQFDEEYDTDGNLVHDWSAELHSFLASDLVDDPAATNSLFNTNDLGIIMTEFLDENPQIFEVVQKDASIIEDFFERYAQYSKNFKSKIDMSFLDKLKKKFGAKESFDVEETLADGSIITITTEDEKPKEGDSVKKDDGSVVEDGDHVTKDGSTISTEGGVIIAIVPAEEEDEGGEEEEEPTPAEMMSAMNDLTESFNAFRTQYGKDLQESQDAIELVHEDLDKRFKTLAASVTGKQAPDYKAGKPKPKKKFSESGYDPDKVREAREAREAKNKK